LKIQSFCIAGLSIGFIYSRRYEESYRMYPWPFNVDESITLVLSITTRKTSILTNENDVNRIKIVGAKTAKKLIIIIIIIIIITIIIITHDLFKWHLYSITTHPYRRVSDTVPLESNVKTKQTYLDSILLHSDGNILQSELFGFYPLSHFH
jgi:hypothetical protein